MITSFIMRCKEKAKRVFSRKMEQLQEPTPCGMDKAQIDLSPQRINVVIQSWFSTAPEPAVGAESIFGLVQRVEKDHALLLMPLRLILVTANLEEAVNCWNRALGLPETGVSQQPEGVVAGKHMSWGTSKESARSIIILPDYVAAAIALDAPAATATLIHELGHVHDDFARGLTRGFRPYQTPPHLNDWPGLCSYIAEEMTWSEYAAESIAAGYYTPEELASFERNDGSHLAGVHTRLRQSICKFLQGQLDFASLWSGSVTNLSDLFANLGRAAAHLPFAENEGEARGRLVAPDSEPVCWRPVVERLVGELSALREKDYSEWGPAPFSRLAEVVVLGFEAAGFFPAYNGNNLHVNVR
jgi:hypothetical protein